MTSTIGQYFDVAQAYIAYQKVLRPRLFGSFVEKIQLELGLKAKWHVHPARTRVAFAPIFEGKSEPLRLNNIVFWERTFVLRHSVVRPEVGYANRILRMPDVRERLSSLGSDPLGSTPEEFGIYIKNQVAIWSKVIKASGVRVE